MTNICHDLQILGHDPSFSVDRAATIFKDSSGVIRTECSKVLDQMKSFEDAKAEIKKAESATKSEVK